jgi:hypothetical protein
VYHPAHGTVFIARTKWALALRSLLPVAADELDADWSLRIEQGIGDARYATRTPTVAIDSCDFYVTSGSGASAKRCS